MVDTTEQISGVHGFEVEKHGGNTETLPTGWDNRPPFRSRTDLLRARRDAKRPHPSFDLDGDGFVSQHDFMESSKFDWNKDGILDGEERKAALNALNNANPRNLFYQPREPKPEPGGAAGRRSRTELLSKRRQENLQTLQDKYDCWKSAQPSLVPSDPLPEYASSGTTWSGIERARRQQKRIEAGLEKDCSSMNPARDTAPSLTYVHDPHHPTRSALRADNKQSLLDAHAQSLQTASLHFKSTQQRLQDREDSLHLMRELAPKGASRAALLQARRNDNMDDLHSTFGRSEQVTQEQQETLDNRPGFWTVNLPYVVKPPTGSAQELLQSRKFWKHPEEEDLTPGDFKSVMKKSYVVEGFVPSAEPATVVAAASQPRRCKAPQSTAIRNKFVECDRTITASAINDERDITMPLYSSFSVNRIYDPAPIPQVSKAREGRAPRRQKKEATPLAAPMSMMDTLSRYRPFTCSSLLEHSCKVRTSGFQLVRA